MIAKKEWIAMLLAGGQGSRLYALTRNVAKPAVQQIRHLQVCVSVPERDAGGG